MSADTQLIEAYQIVDAVAMSRYPGAPAEQVQTYLDEQRRRVSTELFELAVEIYESRITGFGPLTPLMADPEITDIAVNAPDEVWAMRAGGWEMASVLRPGANEPVRLVFRDDDDIRATIERLANRVGSTPTVSNPVVDGRVPNGGPRICLSVPPATPGPSITIRKYRPINFTLRQLVTNVPPTLSGHMALFLDACVKARLNIIVAGGTSSGKTTILAALLARVPRSERIVLLEDTPEITFPIEAPGDGPEPSRNVLRISTARGFADASALTAPEEGLRASLRMAPDRIIVGECRGGEALTMLDAMNTGHEGSMSAVHANSTADAIHRLENLVLKSGTTLPYTAIRSQIGAAIHLIVQLQRDTTSGRRYVSEVAELDWDGHANLHAVPLMRGDHEGGFSILARPSFWDRIARYWPATDPFPWACPSCSAQNRAEVSACADCGSVRDGEVR